ncbi:3-dehydroquinate synthase [Arundinibacter roseus]|uniref:3-dehydroquinate synthase n=1 Tax=Arundinibacter roseus TaxID=2070510 RepID=A0A4R4KAH8_9BACT|nr:3-dehydroquinate synthase [Arundinibacter roseus]TDB64633.1 3-dehydroquinate synthase [Arundinibacter roseus]
MQTIQQQFQVEYSYSIHFTRDLFSPANTTLSQFLQSFHAVGFQRKALFVLDEGMLLHFPKLTETIRAYFQTNVPSVLLSQTILVIPGGEAAKNDPVLFESIVQAIDDQGIDRHSLVVAIGGGAVLDLVGYAAAVSHRGIRHIRIPTTVLSQNDSGVGVKNGINYQGKKNFLGTFAPPVAVFNDSSFLTTLDDRDWRSGISEAIKVALIKDKAFFEWIEEHAVALSQRSMSEMDYLIHRCAYLHTEHIRSGDPFEFGSSRPLDFGHWAAHKLEYLTNFEVRHGEAVAIGIALDSVYSFKNGLLEETALNRILSVFEVLGFELYHPMLAENDNINLRNGLNEFREHLGGRLTIMLLDQIGHGLEVHEMDADLIAESVNFLENRNISV